MSKQFNSVIATQSVIFRGTSAVGVSTSTIPNYRAITGAVYTATLTGGQSGVFGIHVVGNVGGNTYIVAGITALTAAAGSVVLWPARYGSDGVMLPLKAVEGTTTRRIDHIVPPAQVVFQAGGAANAIGISSTITVSAVISSR